MTYLTTPNFYAAPGARSRLREALIGARNPSRSRAVRWARLGDSQETSPGGNATLGDPIIAYELWKRYGNIPESQCIPVTNLGGGSPFAAIGVRETLNASVAAGTALAARFPYCMEPGGNNRFDNSTPTTGALFLCQADLLGVNSAVTEISRTVEYMQRTGLEFHMLVPCITDQGSTIAYRDSLSTTGGPAYFNANTATGTYDITAAQVNDNDFIEISHACNFGASPPTAANLSSSYMQHILVSANASQVEFGPAWFASGNKSGVALTSWGAGGKKMADFLVDRSAWSYFGIAFAPDIVSIQFGANDGPAPVTAAQFALDAEALVSALEHDMTGTVFVLISDTPRTGLTAGQLTEYNLYADALLAVAQAHPDTCVFVNVQRRVTDSYGWTETTAATGGFTADGVHDTIAGARIKGRETVNGLFRVAGLDDLDRTKRSRAWSLR